MNKYSIQDESIFDELQREREALFMGMMIIENKLENKTLQYLMVHQYYNYMSLRHYRVTILVQLIR